MITLLILISIAAATPSYSSEITLNFEGLRNFDGKISYLIFDAPEGFPEDVKKSFSKGSLLASSGQKGIKLNLPPSTYAIAVVHDENSDNKIEKGIFGIPKEGFGFSNNPKIYFGPPSYEKAELKIKKNKKVTIRMNYL